MYSFKIINKETFLAFQNNHEQTNLLQSYDWYKVKGWKALHYGFYRNDTLIATAEIMMKSLLFGFKMGYIARGPITSDLQRRDWYEIHKMLKQIGKENKIIFFKLDPYLDHNLDNIIKLTMAGFTHKAVDDDMSTTIQPVYNAYVEELKLSKKRRNEVNRIEKSEAFTVEHCTDKLDDFVSLIEKTEAKKGIKLRNREYYEKILELYPQSYLTILYLDVEKRKAELIKTNKETIELKTLETMTGQVPVSGTLTVIYNDTAELLYAGNDFRFSHSNTALYTWYKAIEHSNTKWVNLGGVENTLEGGLYEFKSKFKPTIKKFVGEFEVYTYPLISKVVAKAFELYKKRPK